MNARKTTSLIILIIISSLLIISCQQKEAVLDKNSKVDNMSYALGIQYGGGLKQGGLDDLDPDLIAKGIRDALLGSETELTQEEITQAMTDLNAEAQRRAQEAAIEADKAAEVDLLKDPENVTRKEEGEKYLADNALRDGVTVLASGVQYEVLKEGTGEAIGPNAKGQAHYTLSNPGEEPWQSSYESGRTLPFNIAQGGLINGWLEVLPLMKEGAKWKIFIPYTMGYGAQGSGPQIKPFQALVFETEIVSLDK